MARGALDPLGVEFCGYGGERYEADVREAVYGQPVTLLPASDGCDVTPQTGGNLLPRFQAPPFGIRNGSGACDRHRAERSFGTRQLSHQFLSAAIASPRGNGLGMPQFTALCLSLLLALRRSRPQHAPTGSNQMHPLCRRDRSLNGLLNQEP